MVVDIFDSLLQDLGQILKIKDLKLDQANTCLIKFQNGLLVYFEPYKKGDFMLISTNIGEVPPGRFREEVFREALKSNGLSISTAQGGIFGFSQQSNRLVYFGLLALRDLNGEKIEAFLIPFIEKALSWKQDIEMFTVPLADRVNSMSSARPGGVFGLRP